jgi:predicted DNA-binding protein (UPF0251 family)
MPRPKKSRRICGTIPEYNRFGPKGRRNSKSITMTLDEYEAIRLIDYENLMQEEAAQRMNVARTTTQAIYTSARKKIAQSLVEGIDIIIEGGDVTICEAGDNCEFGRHGRRCVEGVSLPPRNGNGRGNGHGGHI